MHLVDPAGVQHFDHALCLGGDTVVAAGLEAAFAVAGQVGNDYLVVGDKTAGEADPQVLVGTEAVDQQQGRRIARGAALEGRQGHRVDRHRDLCQA
ncbi:hypothetical protein PHLH7_34940 [Pseudomonas sp. Ost2]|nr:hypothetical protein PHLH7_34940 [Pseudomonas sp. Ost2]